MSSSFAIFGPIVQTIFERRWKPAFFRAGDDEFARSCSRCMCRSICWRVMYERRGGAPSVATANAGGARTTAACADRAAVTDMI